MERVKPVAGFIGLGIMGRSMAANLLKSGFQVVAFDINPAAVQSLAGAVSASSPKEVAQQSDVVFSCLPSVSAIEAVAVGSDSILEGIKPGQAYFELSTNTPPMVRSLHDRFEEKAAYFLDAPISGGAKGAARGRLAIWVGGDKTQFEKFLPVLKAIGDQPVYVGSIGAGTITKLVANCISQTTQAAIAEIFAMGVKAGAEPLALWEAIRQGSVGRRRTFDGLIEEYLPARFEPPNAAMRISYKDMTIATELGRKLGVPMRFANLALAEIQEAVNKGWAERDCRAVMLLPQQRAGIQIKVSQQDIADVLQRDPPAPTDTKYGKGMPSY